MRHHSVKGPWPARQPYSWVYAPTTIKLGLLASLTAALLLLGQCWPLFDRAPIDLMGTHAWAQLSSLSGKQLFMQVYPMGLVGLGAITVIWRRHRERWARQIVLTCLLVLGLRYLWWRPSTLILSGDKITVIASVGLFLVEISVLSFTLFRLLLHFKTDFSPAPFQPPAVDAVLRGQYRPTVDILIPTYNEPVEILKRTVVGCQAIDYSPKQVLLLDDGQRPEVRQLAAELGCGYLARPQHQHAKAGNLNYALAQSRGELVVVFDADFVPTTNFLVRTVGYFQDPRLGLIQTHQGAYNHEAIARNLGLEAIFPDEFEIFSRHYQRLRDSIGTAICYGSSFVVRRSALEAVGGFATESLSEDYHTAVLIKAAGYSTTYLDEILSAGLLADSVADRLKQKLRWARGTVQSFFVKANPLTIPGLSPLQRLAHLEGIAQWFNDVFRVLFLLTVPLITLLGVTPFQSSLGELAKFGLPFYLLSLVSFGWLHEYSRSLFFSDVYTLTQCVPVALEVLQTLVRPFSSGFHVTPKGRGKDRYVIHWPLALPLLGLTALTGAAFCNWGRILLTTDWTLAANPSLALFMLFSGATNGYGLLVLLAALLCCIDAPLPSSVPWLKLQRRACLRAKGVVVWGKTLQLAETGAELAIHGAYYPNLVELMKLPTLDLAIADAGLTLSGRVTSYRLESSGSLILQVAFEQVSLPQYRQLAELLFCQPGRWQRLRVPNELFCLGLLIRSVVRPKVIFDRRCPLKSLDVAQG